MEMDFSMGGAAGVGDEQEATNPNEGKKIFHRHSPQQLQALEEFFKDCQHPSEDQREQLSRELGLGINQVKYWFQNKRNKTKSQNAKALCAALVAENEDIHTKNLEIREAMKNVTCRFCGGSAIEEETQRRLEKLQLENDQLKEEHKIIYNLLARRVGKPVSPFESLASGLESSLVPLPESSPHKGTGNSDHLDFGSDAAISYNSTLPYQMRRITDTEKALMLQIAESAMKESVGLIDIDEPLWVKSVADGRFVIHHDNYEKIFQRANYLSSSSTRVESSKDSRLLSMSRIQLVDFILDSDKWLDLFPTIVTKAKIIQVLESGSSGNRNGAFQLMYKQLHMLSPLVPPREFFFLRHCLQVEPGTSVIVDVSYELLKEKTSALHYWKRPSGCMIQELPNGASQVTWVEHVEVEDKTQTHRLYKDLLYSNVVYGAETWVATLQRMCERFQYTFGESAPNQAALGVISSPEGRRSIVKLAHRMVKNFCGNLNMSHKLEFSKFSKVNNSGVQVSLRTNTKPGQPVGMIVSMASSLWLPVPYPSVFELLADHKRRFQWDVLCNGNPVNEIVHISNGTHPWNRISVIQPFIPRENNILILQETCSDPLGSLIVYAPIDISAINVAINGKDTSIMPILSSGLTISKDGRPNTGASSSQNDGRSSGSLLTVAIQILVCSLNAIEQFNMESVAEVNTLLYSTIEKIKVALNCSGLD